LASKEVIAMFCITALAIVAMIKEIDTYIYTIAILTISGIAGYQLKAHLPEGIKKFLQKPPNNSNSPSS
ncbi:unnamed protein product, partial [marine sediment metagenome]